MGQRFLALGICLLLGSCHAVDDVEVALEGDDQCTLGEEGCALHALQMKAGKTEDTTESSDITLAFFSAANKSLRALQPYIVKEWTALVGLEGICDLTMLDIKNLTGHRVVWNAGYKAPPPSGRRRRRTVGRHLPRRTKVIMYLIVAMQREMTQFWHKFAIVDRKRIGILNELTIYPYGPSMDRPALTEAQESLAQVGSDDQEAEDDEEEDQEAEGDEQEAEGEMQLDESQDEDLEEPDFEAMQLDMAGSDAIPAQKGNEKLITDNDFDLLDDIRDAKNKTQNLTSKVDDTVGIVKRWIAKR